MANEGTITACSADCTYQVDDKCTCEGGITLNEDFECEMYDEKEIEDDEE